VNLRTLARGNVGALAVISLLNDTAGDMIYPLLPLFLAGTLGAGAAFLGLVEGVAESVASLMKLAGGVISDRSGRRKGLVGLGYAIATFGRPLIAVASAPWQVLAVRSADRVGKGLRTAPRDALLVDSVPTRQRGTAFGLHRGADHLGGLIGPFIAAGLLLVFPGNLRLVFALALVPGVLALLVLWLGVRDVPRGETPPTLSAAPAGDELARGAGRLGADFVTYVGVVVLFTLGNASDAFLLLRANDLGVPTAAIPLLWGLLHVSKAVWSVPGGALSDRLGPRRVVSLGWVVYALVYGGFARASAAWHVWVLFGCYGLFFGLCEAPEKALVASYAPSAARARAFGWFHASVGIAALPASVLFGWIWETRGPEQAFLVGAGLALAAAAVLWLLVREGADSGRLSAEEMVATEEA
jgi:MFS family permease